MEKIAKTLSLIFSPLLIPTYGVTLSLLSTVLIYSDTSVQWHVILTTLALTGAIPLITIFVLQRLGYVSNADLTQREQRTIPFSVAFLAYLGCSIYLFSVNAPAWLTMFLVGGAATIAIVEVINFRWKISAHSAGIGGLTALALHIMARKLCLNPSGFETISLIIILAAGLVATSRLILKRHTIWQVICGFAVGFTSVFIATDINY